MAKKRQADFPKTKLRPGRSIVKKKNVTNTSFKSKKINFPSKGHRSRKPEFAISDCLASVKTGVISARVDALKHLNLMIVNQTEIFFSSIAEVLQSVAILIVDSNSFLREEALNVIKSILEITDDIKICSFIPLLINVLSCAMTNTAIKIKENALILLHCMLKNHPDLICNSSVILKNLLHMIVGSPRKWSHPMSETSVVYSTDWRVHVLGHMNLFLKEMLKNVERNVEDEQGEQEVYWDCKGPLNLEIYAGGGLKPVDIEKYVSNSLTSQELYSDDPSIIDEFIIPIVTLIPEIIIEELSGEIKSEGIYSSTIIKDMSILFQVLSHIAEWIQLTSCEEAERIITTFLIKNIFANQRFPFYHKDYFFESMKSPDKEEVQLNVVKLNLAVCYLYSRFLLETENHKDEYITAIFMHIKTVFQKSYSIKYDSIPMLVKIMKFYYGMTEMTEVSDFISDSLYHMVSLAKNDDRENKDILISLFVKLSLDSAYHFLAETKAMKNWLMWLLSQLIEVPKTEIVDKKLLRVMKKIANRRDPYLLKLMAEMDNNVIKGLLKYDNDDVRDTVIFLIYYMEDISVSLLEDISNVILLDSSFPTKYAIRLIRLLTSRFTEKHRITNTEIDIKDFRRGRIRFIQFLLNIAIVQLNYINVKRIIMVKKEAEDLNTFYRKYCLNSEKWTKYEANEYTKAMIRFQDVALYNVFPSIHWTEHSVLFEVCQRSLIQLPPKLVKSITELICKEILDPPTRNLPMHSAIAILKLNNYDVKERHYQTQMYNLSFSSLLTTSVLTYMQCEDEWMNNVKELMNSVDMNRQIALHTIELRFKNSADDLDGYAIYHILRVVKFFIDKQLLLQEDGVTGIRMLELLKEGCSDKTLMQQPLFIQLYKYFDFHF